MSNNKLEKRRRRLISIRRRNIVINIVCVSVALCILIWAIRLFWRYVNYEITNDAMVEQYITPLNIRVNGYIRDIRFMEHQQVRKGDTLLIVDDREYRIALEKAETELEEAEAELNLQNATLESDSTAVYVQQAMLDEGLLQLAFVQHTFERQTILKKKKIIGELDYEQAKTNFHSEEKHIATQRLQLKEAERKVAETKARIRTAQKVIQNRQSDIEQARLNLSYCTVTAPCNGTIGRRSLDIGQQVRENQTVSYIIPAGRKWVTANYRETQIANISIGQKVHIHVDAFPGRTFHGRIISISAATGAKFSLVPTDNAAGNFVKVQQRIPVNISIDDASDREMAMLRAGMMVEVEALKQ